MGAGRGAGAFRRGVVAARRAVAGLGSGGGAAGRAAGLAPARAAREGFPAHFAAGARREGRRVMRGGPGSRGGAGVVVLVLCVQGPHHLQ